MALQKQLLTAYFWTLLGKWGARVLGIGSTLILARLLDPSAFGLMALSTICIGLFETMSNIGIKSYLFTRTDLNPEDLNSSWSLNIVLKFVVTLLLVALSSPLAIFVNAPEVELIITIVAINGFFAAFNNIGLLKQESQLQFQRITKLALFTKVITVTTTLIFAFFNPSYWALVAGGIVGVWCFLLGSYVIDAFRPKLLFKFKREQVSFSSFAILRSVISYCRNKADTFFVSKFFDPSAVGKYSIGLEFAVLPSNEVIGPATAAMFPGFAKFKNDRAAMYDKVYKYFAVVYLFLIPAIVGVTIIAPQFTYVVLGEKWAGTEHIMAALAVMMLPFQFTTISKQLFDFAGKIKLSVFIDVIALLLLGVVVYSVAFEDIGEFAAIRGYLGLVMYLLMLLFAHYVVQLSLRKMMSIMLVPALASAIMYVSFLALYQSRELTIIGLFSNMLQGALIYSLFVRFFIWVASHKSTTWLFWHYKIRDIEKKLMRKFSCAH